MSSNQQNNKNIQQKSLQKRPNQQQLNDKIFKKKKKQNKSNLNFVQKQEKIQQQKQKDQQNSEDNENLSDVDLNDEEESHTQTKIQFTKKTQKQQKIQQKSEKKNQSNEVDEDEGEEDNQNFEEQEEQKLEKNVQQKPERIGKLNIVDDEEGEGEGQVTMGNDIDDKRKVIFILEKAPIETAKINKNIELLNCDDHRNFITKRLKQDFAKYRPDIVHQCLLTILDSPLNKAGFVKVYIHTEKNQLIEINPSTKIPRTFKRFSALFCQLLQKLRIRAQQTSDTLLKIIKNPITRHIPYECQKIGTSTQARLVKLSEFIPTLPNNEPIVFVIGAVATGNPALEIDYINDSICISKYSLSGSYCIAKIINAFEDFWKIH